MKTVLKKDMLYMVSNEEYSDYGVRQVIRPKEDIDVGVLKAQINQKEYERWRDRQNEFEGLLYALCDIVRVEELHIGSYGELEPEVVGTVGDDTI